MPNGKCAKCSKPKAHPKSAYCEDHRRDYMREYMRKRKTTKKISTGVRSPRYLVNVEYFLNWYEGLQGKLLDEVQSILITEGVLKHGKVDYYAIHNKWASVGDALEGLDTQKTK